MKRDLERQYTIIHNRLDTLRQCVPRSSVAQEPLVNEALEALAASLEELTVAQEELRQQNEELQAIQGRLEEERRHYRSLFALAPDGYLVTDCEGTIREANRAAVGFLGVRADALRGKPLILFLGREEQDAFFALIRRLRAGDDSQAVWEACLQPRQGGDFRAAISVAPMYDDAGDLASIRWLIRDITARNRMERELEDALVQAQRRNDERQWLLEASQAVLECHTFKDAARRIFDAARHAIGAVSGYVALLNEATGENDVLFLEAGGLPCAVDPDLPMPVRGLRAEAYQRAEVVYDNDFQAGRWVAFIPPGHVILRNVLFAPLTLDQKVVGVIGLANKPEGFTDYDARVARHFGEMAAIALSRIRTEEAADRYAAELKTSNRDLAQFADALSHDLREPARMVEIFLELLAGKIEGNLDEKTRQYLDYATESAGRMRDMISGLLDLSRVQSQGSALDVTDAGQVLNLTLLNLTRVIRESGAAVTYDPLPRVGADAAQLGQVFQNLIANGIKFRRDGVAPRIHVSAELLPPTNSPRRGEDGAASPPPGGIEGGRAVAAGAGRSPEHRPPPTNSPLRGEDGAASPPPTEGWGKDGSFWRFAVQDNGIGFDPAEIDRVFHVFQRLHTEAEHPGLGIGLAICKRIVERHGGHIWAASEPGAGSTFYFTIPAVRREPERGRQGMGS